MKTTRRQIVARDVVGVRKRITLLCVRQQNAAAGLAARWRDARRERERERERERSIRMIPCKIIGIVEFSHSCE